MRDHDVDLDAGVFTIAREEELDAVAADDRIAVDPGSLEEPIDGRSRVERPGRDCAHVPDQVLSDPTAGVRASRHHHRNKQLFRHLAVGIKGEDGALQPQAARQRPQGRRPRLPALPGRERLGCDGAELQAKAIRHQRRVGADR